jgi:hypothetical protein
VTTVATRKAKPQRKPGVLIDVARFISASQDRTTGRVDFRFRYERGRIVALRMRRQQFQTFANRADELAEALDE